MNKESEEVKPQHILLKVSWASSIKLLTVKERGDVFTNIFNYHSGDDLIPMSKASQLFFAGAVELFEYNLCKYNSKVEANRVNGKLGGRPKKNNPENPSGLKGNPNNLKEKDKEKDNVNENEIVKLNDSINDKINFQIKDEDAEVMRKFKLLLEFESSYFSDLEEKVFFLAAKSLVSKFGWQGFYELVFCLSIEECTSKLIKENMVEYRDALVEVRKNHIFYLKQIIK